MSDIEARGVEDVFEKIRRACREVTRRARFVRIDEDGLHGFAKRLAAVRWPEAKVVFDDGQEIETDFERD